MHFGVGGFIAYSVFSDAIELDVFDVGGTDNITSKHCGVFKEMGIQSDPVELESR